MAHFAKLDPDNNVVSVSVIDNENILKAGIEDETTGIAYLIRIHNYPFWKQTSYNGTFRKNYAGVGYTYDATRDAFIPPQPFNSWSLNEDTCQWEASTPYPTDGKNYTCDESATNWVEITGET